jgi:hypothetical protein
VPARLASGRPPWGGLRCAGASEPDSALACSEAVAIRNSRWLRVFSVLPAMSAIQPRLSSGDIPD